MQAFTQVAEAVYARIQSGVIDPMDEVNKWVSVGSRSIS